VLGHGVEHVLTSSERWRASTTRRSTSSRRSARLSAALDAWRPAAKVPMPGGPPAGLRRQRGHHLVRGVWVDAQLAAERADGRELVAGRSRPETIASFTAKTTCSVHRKARPERHAEWQHGVLCTLVQLELSRQVAGPSTRLPAPRSLRAGGRRGREGRDMGHGAWDMGQGGARRDCPSRLSPVALAYPLPPLSPLALGISLAPTLLDPHEFDRRLLGAASVAGVVSHRLGVANRRWSAGRRQS